MIGIITLYYSENCGSVLQAGALRYALGQLGYDATFIRTRNKESSHNLGHMLRSAITHLTHGDMVNVGATLSRYANFARTLRDFDSVPIARAQRAGVKTLVVGSDTVWDVTNRFFAALPDLFWPRDLLGLKAIAYAPSAANATVDQIASLGYPAHCLQALHRVSARDRHTQEIVRQLSGREAPLVLDPTLLADQGFYSRYLHAVPQEKYLLVYWYDRQDQATIDAVKGYAQIHGLTTVSMGRRRKWCEKYVDASVDNFVSYFHHASLVVTNTFHGTVFSILNRRNFACLGGDKKKIAQLLPALGLEGRMAMDLAHLQALMDTPVDYTDALPRLDALRSKSMDYLKDALSSI